MHWSRADAIDHFVVLGELAPFPVASSDRLVEEGRIEPSEIAAVPIPVVKERVLLPFGVEDGRVGLLGEELRGIAVAIERRRARSKRRKWARPDRGAEKQGSEAVGEALAVLGDQGRENDRGKDHRRRARSNRTCARLASS